MDNNKATLTRSWEAYGLTSLSWRKSQDVGEIGRRAGMATNPNFLGELQVNFTPPTPKRDPLPFLYDVVDPHAQVRHGLTSDSRAGFNHLQFYNKLPQCS